MRLSVPGLVSTTREDSCHIWFWAQLVHLCLSVKCGSNYRKIVQNLAKAKTGNGHNRLRLPMGNKHKNPSPIGPAMFHTLPHTFSKSLNKLAEAIGLRRGACSQKVESVGTGASSMTTTAASMACRLHGISLTNNMFSMFKSDRATGKSDHWCEDD